MPLTDVVRYLNDRDREQRPLPTRDDPFYATVRGAIARYARITLDSGYAPIRDADGGLHGHTAILQAHGELNDVQMHPDAVFTIPGNNAEFIHLDRLVRTLHALNYLVHPEPGRLYIKVNQRHIESVPEGHGQVFEDTLRACGLEPSGITLEVTISGEPHASLYKAVAAYRERGYGISVTRHGFDWSDMGWLPLLRPDVVRLDSTLLQSQSLLEDQVERLADLGILSLVALSAGDGQLAGIQAERAKDAGVSLVQHPPDSDNYLDRAFRLQTLGQPLAAPG